MEDECRPLKPEKNVIISRISCGSIKARRWSDDDSLLRPPPPACLLFEMPLTVS